MNVYFLVHQFVLERRCGQRRHLRQREHQEHEVWPRVVQELVPVHGEVPRCGADDEDAPRLAQAQKEGSRGHHEAHSRACDVSCCWTLFSVVVSFLFVIAWGACFFSFLFSIVTIETN